MHKLIIEMSNDSVRLMAALAHTVLQKYPDNVAAQDIIDELVQQSMIVHRDPAEHGVGVYTTSKKVAFTSAPSEIAATLDYSFLGGMTEGYYW